MLENYSLDEVTPLPLCFSLWWPEVLGPISTCQDVKGVLSDFTALQAWLAEVGTVCGQTRQHRAEAGGGHISPTHRL